MLYLLMEIKGQNVYTLETVHGMVKESLHDYYLPETEEKILLSLNYLHHVGLIIFINTPKGSWVVFKKQALLAEVNGKIFASKTFKPSATGENNFLYLFDTVYYCKVVYFFCRNCFPDVFLSTLSTVRPQNVTGISNFIGAM